ncbi:hypothetical protein HK405_015880 [Cladochytrium tenue]|nr:hypothetical protein HK405_015880 [Cladochytrium tenue]
MPGGRAALSYVLFAEGPYFPPYLQNCRGRQKAGLEREKALTLLPPQVVVGSGGVGKSCLTVRFLKDDYAEEYDPTIEETYRKQVVVDGQAVICNITDTAGQLDYAELRDQHLLSGDGFLLVFAVDDGGSFDEVKAVRERILRAKDVRRVPVVVCANKSDVAEAAVEVDAKTLQAYARPLKLPIFTTSAKAGCLS